MGENTKENGKTEDNMVKANFIIRKIKLGRKVFGMTAKE